MVRNGVSPISSRSRVPCPNGGNVGFSLQQFSEVLKIRDAAGQPYILIGGQAVNYWAERYLAVEPQLEPLKPFTSEDIDFKGGHADVQRIARQLELTPGYPLKVQMTALAGTIPFQIGGLQANIEIVRRIPGVSGSPNVATALEIEGENHIRPVTWDEWITLPVRENDNSVQTVKGAVRVPTVIAAVNYAKVQKKRPKLCAKAIRERDANRCQYTGRLLHPDEVASIMSCPARAVGRTRGKIWFGPRRM